jgi:predicted ArsR family transcriptional regulator
MFEEMGTGRALPGETTDRDERVGAVQSGTRLVALAYRPYHARVARADWTFLTNHAHVLLSLARDPDARLREVAEWVGVTERAVQGIVADLVKAGYLTRERVGRRNRYTIHTGQRLRHPVEREHHIGELLSLFAGRSAGAGPGRAGLDGAGPRVDSGTTVRE